MDLIEKNNQINMTSDHSVSSNNSFKASLIGDSNEETLDVNKTCWQ